MGSAGDSPAPVGDPPTGMAKRHREKGVLPLIRPAVSVPSGVSPDGTGESPVLPENDFSDTLLKLSCQFPRNLLVQNFLHRQGDDGFAAALEKTFNLAQGVVAITERHEKAFLAILAHHHGFKGINVGTGEFVSLFYLNRIPAFFQGECAFLFFARRGGGTHGIDVVIHAHVADPDLVRDAPDGDDGPVLKLKRWNGAQFFCRPRQIADDEAASVAPGRFAFRQTAHVAQAFCHVAAGNG